MQLQKIAQYDGGKGLTFQEALAEAAKRKMRLPTNLELDERLQGKEWEKEKEMYPCWTGTLIVYEAPGKPFGKTVEWEGLRVLVPKAFQGKKDMAIVCNHPGFLTDGKEIALGKEVKCIPIPSSDGWYLPEKQFGIPNGEKGEDDGKRRYLWRWSHSYIGLVARWCDRWFDGFRRGVGCGEVPCRRLGVFGVPFNGKMPKHKHEWVCKTCGEALGGKKTVVQKTFIDRTVEKGTGN